MDQHSTPHDVEVEGADQLMELAGLFSSQGRHGQAAQYLRAALRAAQVAGDIRSTMRVLDLLAWEHGLDGNTAEAVRCARSLVAVTDALGSEADQARARFRLVDTWTTNPDGAPEIEPFAVIGEIDQLLLSVAEEQFPGHAIRRNRLVAAVLAALGRFREAATEWSNLADVVAAIGERAEAFECRCHEVQCRLDDDDIAGAHRGFCVLLATLADVERRETIERAVIAASEHFLLREDERFWSAHDDGSVAACPVDLADLLAAHEDFFAEATTPRRRANYLALRALVACETEPDLARVWIAEARELISELDDSLPSDARVRGIVTFADAHLAAALGDSATARRLFAESTVEFVHAPSPDLAQRAAVLAKAIDDAGTEVV